MNWDNVKYLFQIPLSWFKSIHDRVFKSYGGNFITVKEGDDGGTEVSVNEDAFVAAVQAVAPSGGGTVTSVDGHNPDANGAVSFGLTASKWVKTDASGHLTTTNDTVVTVGSSDTPVTVSNKKVVTGVSWNGTKMTYSSEKWNFKNGVLVKVTANSDTDIDTPYQITWS